MLHDTESGKTRWHFRVNFWCINKFFLPSGINRTLIPRYYRSIFEGGVTDLRYELRHPKESFHNTSITMDVDQCTIVTLHGKPMFTKVCFLMFCYM